MIIENKYLWDRGELFSDSGNLDWLCEHLVADQIRLRITPNVAFWYRNTFGHGFDSNLSHYHIREDLHREIMTITLSEKEYAMMCLRFAK